MERHWLVMGSNSSLSLGQMHRKLPSKFSHRASPHSAELISHSFTSKKRKKKRDRKGVHEVSNSKRSDSDAVSFVAAEVERSLVVCRADGVQCLATRARFLLFLYVSLKNSVSLLYRFIQFHCFGLFCPNHTDVWHVGDAQHPAAC